MPLTPFQKEVMAVLAANRSETSHVAGGVVINATDDSARFSKDFDIFHDSIEELAAASSRDVASLQAAGFEVEKLEREDEWQKPASFRKGRAIRGSDAVEIADYGSPITNTIPMPGDKGFLRVRANP